MAKKLSQAEHVAAMLDEGKVREYVTKHTLYPAVLVGGTKKDGEERVRYRCAHCRHEWDKVYPNYFSRHANSLECPVCKNRMLPARRIPAESEKCIHTFQLYDGFQVRNFRYILHVDAAEIDGTEGLIISEYAPTVEYEFSDVPESFTVQLELLAYGFVSASHKLLYHSNGTKTTRFLRNAFNSWNAEIIATEDAEHIKPSLPWMHGYSDYKGNSWLNAFDTYWSGRNAANRRPRGERHAEQTLNAFAIPDFPEVTISAAQIVGKEIAEDVITGKHHMEYFCVSCGARFSADVVHDRSSTKCPVCGISTCQGCRLVIGSTCEDVGVISMLDKSTVLLRAGKITCFYDADFVPRYEKREMYRTIIELDPGSDPKVHFLVNEGYGDNKVWVKKKNYAANKFHYSIKQLEYLDDLEALKYTGFREFIAYKINKSPYTHSIPISDIIHYIRFQSMYPVVEQLCKRGFVATLEDEIRNRANYGKSLMDLSAKKVTDVVGLPERLIKVYLKGPDYYTRLETFRALYCLDPDVREEDITWLELHGIRSAQVEDVLHESQMSIMRLCEYLENVRINQCFAPNNAITDWRDYLHAAKTIGVDLTDNKARYPSSLKREHDRAVAKQKLVLDAKKDESFQMETERYGGLYSYKTDAYMIIPPKNMKDLFEEGRKLNHCVGSYSDRIVEGKGCIMFIRKTEEPDKPYFTIEINRSGNYVEQLRANSNRRINHSTEKELVKFLKEWSKKKNVALNSAA